jgi:hypothetical protein
VSDRSAWIAILGATIGISIVADCGPNQPPTEPRNDMSNHAVNAPEIRNSDVTWDGTPLGLQPRIANPKTAHLVDAPASLDRQLVELLRDPDRFAVAHVLLTMRHDALKSFDANQWNGLRVTLAASGAVQYDPADMATLYRRWSSLVGSSKD